MEEGGVSVKDPNGGWELCRGRTYVKVPHGGGKGQEPVGKGGGVEGEMGTKSPKLEE